MNRMRVLSVVLAALLTWSGASLTAEPSATPRLDWLFDRSVTSVARIGNTLYVGGWFRTIRPASAPTANTFYAVAPATGALVPSIIPPANASITALTPDGSGGYFIAGRFTNIGSARVAHILADGSIDPAFQFPHVIEGVITSLVRVGPSLVAGGNSLHVDSVFRPLFAMNPVTGALSPWAPILPNQDINVRAVVVANDLLIVLSRNGNATVRFVTAYDGVTGAVVWQTDVTGAPGHFAPGAMGMSGGRLIVGMGRLYSLDPLTGVVDPSWAAGMPVAEGLFAMAIGPSAIYVGGTFQVYWGQPRGRLAAVDPATGTLLPWNPQATDSSLGSGFIGKLALSPTGSVFVASTESSGPLTINGQEVGTVAEIDATGALTAFRSAAPVESVELLQMSSTNTLFVSGFSGYVGQAVRTRLAAFDLTTNTLLPQTITVTNLGVVGTIDQLSASGTVLHLRGWFDMVNGVPRAGRAAVDTATNAVITWPASGLAVQGLPAAAGGWEYVSVDARLRRINPATGALDVSWQPPVGVGLDLADAGVTFALREFPGTNGIFGSAGSGVAFGTLDPVTGQFFERMRTTSYLGGGVSLMGDTAFAVVGVKGTVPGPVLVGSTVLGFDTKTFLPVTRPAISGSLGSLAIGDGRFFLGGTYIGIGADVRYGALEVQLPGSFTSWDSGFRPHTGFSFSPSVAVAGNVVIAFGTYESDRWRMAVFDLTGTRAPSNLRARTAGGAVEFTWDGAAVPSAGGYVLEAGLAAGQTAVAVPVGGGTGFVTPVLVPGPVFVRMRTPGSTEVSNEVVVGCVAPPLPPTALTTSLTGTNLSLAWSAPAGDITGYTLLAGTAAGLSDVVTLPLGPQTSVSGTVPGGTFYARVTASNACGTSGPSGEVFFTIGAPDPLPAAPTNLAASVSGSTVSLAWTAPAGVVTSYVLEAGTGAGLANLGTLAVGATSALVVPGVPAGTYVLRVRAVNSAGSGAPSSDVVVVVP